MSTCIKFYATLVLLVCVVCGCSEQQLISNSDLKLPEGLLHKLSGKGTINKWMILGPFPNPETSKGLPEPIEHLGFYKDYLKAIGGEEKAIITTETTVSFTDKDNNQQKVKAQSVTSRGDGVVSFDKIYGNVDFKVAYAFCHILSEKTQTAGFFFGSDDGAKVWINGNLVHSNYVARGLVRGQDKFTAKLNKGLNTVLVKVSERTGDWAFVLEAVDGDNYKKMQAEKRKLEEFIEALNCRLVPKLGNPIDFNFRPSKFPEIQWDRPYLVEKIMGKFDINVRWFDNQLNEVTVPKKSGRYAFVAEGTTAKGKHIRQAATLYCGPENWQAWLEKPKAYLDYVSSAETIDKDVWQENREAIASYTGRMVMLSIMRQQEGAILMSYLDDLKSTGEKPSKINTPIIRDHEYHLALKRKILGVENKYPLLKMPKTISGSLATALHEGTTQQASVKAGTAEKIRQICQQWYEESGEPFAILIARHGVIIIHEAFGEGPRGKVTTETAMPVASITKLITGLMFAQFVDQGLINIDDPVGKYLPDFPVTGDKAITLRQCFTHTTGLSGHKEWGGMDNPWLENVIANGLDHLKPGKFHNYNGMGYDLAGKVMEVVSGKSIFRLMRENLFDPLGLENTVMEEDLGFSCNTTAKDLATMGQMLLNKGSYGKQQFFSPQTFDQIMPKPLQRYYPGINLEWGIGITWMRHPHPQAGKNGMPKDKTILSKNIVGHGSATSAILRVDLDNDMVIAQTRRNGGKVYNKNLTKLLIAIDDNLIE
ncbi:MAG: beta-lactamase family protein [Planctomycetes bacterium]|nr:beta-lactamase family protein [Planctomycetota bacterium]